MCTLLYSLGKVSYTMLAKIFDTWPSLVYRWIVEAGAQLPDKEVPGEIKEMEFDEMWYFVGSKKNMFWIIKALDCSTRRVVAWVLGHRDTATFKCLYNKVKHLERCVFYTDDWDVFVKVLSKDRYIIGKKHITVIEQDDSDACHHLGRFTRRTKVVSKCDTMVDTSIKLWANLATPDIFTQIQTIVLSPYK